MVHEGGHIPPRAGCLPALRLPVPPTSASGEGRDGEGPWGDLAVLGGQAASEGGGGGEALVPEQPVGAAALGTEWEAGMGFG